MKRIIAFIKPIMLDDVVFALHAIESFPGAKISEVQSIGRRSSSQWAQDDHTPFHEFPKSIRIEIVCASTQAEELIETIRQKAHTGLPDDGRIYLSPVDDAIRIDTGEHGELAAQDADGTD